MLVRPGIRALLLALLALALGAVPALAVPKVDGEFDVPGAFEASNKLALGPEGNMWVTLSGLNNNDVARISPAGVVDEFDLGADGAQGIASLGGKLWITRNGGVTSFDPKEPDQTEEPTNIAAINVFHSIVVGPDGNLWVATVDNLVRISPTQPPTNKVFPQNDFTGRDIEVAGTQLVIADSNKGGVLTMTAADPPVITREIDLPGASQGVAGTPTGQFAYTQPTEDPREVGVVNPGAAPLVSTFPQADPFGIALGSDDAYWSPESNDDVLIRVTRDGKATTLGGLAKDSRPRQIAAGPGNTLWVTLQDTSKVARISGLEPPKPPPPPPPPPPPTKAPETKIGKGPKGEVPTTRKRAKVKFTFSSTSAGASFECRMVKVVGKKAKGPKAPKFKACKSPKTFKLKPGKYRFEVRAVLKGVPDATPAKRSFKVVRVFPVDQ